VTLGPNSTPSNHLYCLVLLRKNGNPFSMASALATGRQTERPYASSADMLIKLSIASPPFEPDRGERRTDHIPVAGSAAGRSAILRNPGVRTFDPRSVVRTAEKPLIVHNGINALCNTHGRQVVGDGGRPMPKSPALSMARNNMAGRAERRI
jgi:hypothetical protein